MTQEYSNYILDNAFAEKSIPFWENTLHNVFGSDLIKVEFRKELILQKQYWDILLFFDEGIVKRIDVKSRRDNWIECYKRDTKRAIETRGNIESGKLGSSIFNSKAEYWGTGFFNYKEILYPFIFDRELVARKVKELMIKFPTKYKEIINKSTDGLYHSGFVLVEEKYLTPYRIPILHINTLYYW